MHQVSGVVVGGIGVIGVIGIESNIGETCSLCGVPSEYCP